MDVAVGGGGGDVSSFSPRTQVKVKQKNIPKPVVSPQLFPRQETLTSETFKLPRVHAPLRVTCLRGKSDFLSK